MTYFLFLVYLLLFSWLVTRVRFFQQTGLIDQWLVGLFLLKVAAGVAYGWFFTTIPNWQQSADTWKFFFDAKNDTKLLFENPWKYFSGIFANPYGKEYRHLFSSTNSYWNDLKHIYMVKIVSIFNIFSGSRYYVNVIFYSFITFFGPMAFIRVMNDVFPGRLLLITVSTFLFPSFIFWSSGIHKEGLIFLYIALMVYILYFSLKEKRVGIKQMLLVAALILLIFPVRNHVVLACIPGLAAWWLAEKYFTRKWFAFLMITILSTAIFFGSKFIHPKLDLPISIVLRRNDFVKLGGNSFLPMRELKSNILSFILTAPQALNHTLARPYITEIYSPLYLVCAIEILFAWLLVCAWFLRPKENPYRHSVIMFLFLVSMILLLLTGYIVPQLGAIVRYRAIFFPFIMVPIISTIQRGKTN
jgi:hypothetical protein